MSRSRFGAVGALIATVAALLPVTAAAERYIVQFKDPALGKAALQSSGARVVRELGPQNAAAAVIPPQALSALRNNPHIEFIEEDPVRAPLAQTTPYGIEMVQAKDAQTTYGVTGANRKVCVIDSGFYTGHEDLQTSGVSGYPGDWSTDRCGHGTHVAGTIAALNNTAGVEGVLPNGVDLFIVKVFGDDCSWSYASDLVDAANRCRQAGAHIISMSLGGGWRSRVEQRAFDDLYAAGLLSVAAAGNDGSNSRSYPASYDSVISVAALDSQKQVASFSQKNSQVELAAPGVGVLSTVPYLDTNTITVDGTTRHGNHVEHSARTSGVSGPLAFGGLCDSVGAWSGKVVLCERGSISFYDKVMNVQSGGGVAAVIYNNTSGELYATLGDGNSSAIPAIGLTQTDGQALVNNSLGQTATVVSVFESPGSGYEAWDGTSMATPHVSGVAALVWSYNTAWSNADIRAALQATAEDLGSVGRDDAYGYGLVRARAALDHLTASGGGGGGDAAIALTVTGTKVRGTKYADLSWSGATSTNVDVYRDGGLVDTTANDGAWSETLGKGGGSYTYRVCEAGTSVCSADVVVSF